VVLSQYANALYAFELFQEGTAGLAYLLKDRVGDLDQLLGAIDAVTKGGSVIDPQVVESLLAVGATATDSGIESLTPREDDVIREMAQGKSNQAIADTLYISESAVEKHISSILTKLQLDPADSTINQRVAAVLSFLRSYNPGEDP
jgi:DNA-binding NarL/FixJ family response regulator